MKRNIRKSSFRSKKKKVLGKPNIISREEYEGLGMDTKLELICQFLKKRLFKSRSPWASKPLAGHKFKMREEKNYRKLYD